MVYVLAYLNETRDPTERKRLKTAMENYVSSRGLPPLNFIANGLQQAIANVLQRGDVRGGRPGGPHFGRYWIAGRDAPHCWPEP